MLKALASLLPCSFFFVLLVATWGTASAQSGSLLFFQQSSGSVFQINQTTGVSTLLATEAGHFWNGAAYNPSSGLVYVSDVGTANETGGIGNAIYSFNPNNPAGGVTEIGTMASQPSFFDATYYNGKYYTIPIGTTTLLSYNFTGLSGTGAISPSTTQTLGGIGSASGFLLGDLTVKNDSLYIYGLALYGPTGNPTGATNMLIKYNSVSNLSSPAFAVVESGIGAGLVYSASLDKLILTNTDNTLYYVDPNTGVETYVANITGPDSGGNGDYTLVPEASNFYGVALALLLGGLASALRRRQQPTLAPCATV